MIDDTDNLAEPLEPETAGTEIDGDELLETEGEDNPEEETEPEDDTDEVEFEGKKYRVSKDIKDALLRQADYTRKTQELAEHRNQVSATIERLTAVSHEETQALAQVAMVAAQKLNLDDKPIYGIYVNGRNWFFVALEGNQYAVSNPYVITTDDIFDLYAVLLYFKQLMDELYQTI